MRDIDWKGAIVAVVLLTLCLAANNAFAAWKGQGTWHPTTDLNEVVVMVNWMAANKLVPCGEHGNAQGCAFPPDKYDVPRKGKLCVITHPKFNASPTDDETAVIGELFETCLTQAQTRIITVRWERGINTSAQVHDEYVYAMPCGISISFTTEMWVRGHEVLHCSRGHWHD